MSHRIFRWSLACALLMPAAAALNAQSPGESPLVASEGCPSGINFEQQHYQIGTVTVKDPFDFLYWIRSRINTTQGQLRPMLEGKPFTYQAAVRDALALIEQQRMLPDNAIGFRVTVQIVSATNCRTNPNSLDLRYGIYSTMPAKILTGTAESQRRAMQSPQEVAGLSQAGSIFHLTPAGGFDGSYRWFGGGRLEVAQRGPSIPVFNRLVLEGRGSSTMHEISGALTGAAEPRGIIGHVDWRLDYFETSIPVRSVTLGRAQLSGQVSAATRPFWDGNMTARFGAQVEGGNQGSTFLPSELAPHTVAGAGYGALKFYGGVASRLSHNVFSGTYGLEIASVTPVGSIDWRKQLVDIADDFWIPVRPHYPLMVETRFTGGSIHVSGAIPAAERFYGGNGATTLIPGDSWQIRDAPVIRAIPANRFYLTRDGAGASSFTAMNLTMSVPVKAWPLVPTTVSREVGPLLDGQITSATSLLQNHYSMASPTFQEILKLLNPLETVLAALRTTVATAQDAEAFSDCDDAILGADFNVKQALRKQAAPKPDPTLYGSAIAPITDIPDVIDACATALIPQVHDTAVQQKIREQTGEAGKLRDRINQLNIQIQPAAASKADRETRFVRRTIHTLIDDLDLLSVGPVAVLDIAHIGPVALGSSGLRYGPGGGVRLSIASAVNFTLGYAWNVNRQPGENAGAVFFSIGVRDLFH